MQRKQFVQSLVRTALEAAAAAARTADRAPPTGCGRAYVRLSLGELDAAGKRAWRAALSTECKKHGWRWLGSDSGSNRDSIYVGYDNADGVAMGQALAMANALKSAGFACYADGVDD